MAACDSRYCFTLIDVGEYGSDNDSGVLLNSEMGKRFRDGEMNLPAPEDLQGSCEEKNPYFLLGDEISPLSEWLLRPYF